MSIITKGYGPKSSIILKGYKAKFIDYTIVAVVHIFKRIVIPVFKRMTCNCVFNRVIPNKTVSK